MQYEILAEHTEPGRKARFLKAPQWVLEGPTAPAALAINAEGMLYRHQTLGLEALSQNANLVISTGTASGKTLVFQLGTLDTLLRNPEAKAIAMYPLKALSRDQLGRWRQTAVRVDMNPQRINKIDGDVADLDERTDLLEKSRIALMTPDIVHRWLLNYSDNNMNTLSKEVNRTKRLVREFIRNLSVIIIDEAHAYETAFGANMAYMMRRLRAKRRELNPQGPEPLIIAASATILNPKEHLELLTGLRFSEVGEDDNGSPKAPLTIQHVAGRTQGIGSEEDITSLIQEILKENRDDSYIAFADDRQKVERIAASIEPTEMIHEEDIIEESKISMPYRAGLQARELIEEKLKSGEIRGVVSTSALEMGIDIPELTVGINLGLPASIKRTRQRAGRVGRTMPGRFIIIEQPEAFQYDEGGLRGYWSRPVEPAQLYLGNRFLQRVQADCLNAERDSSGAIPDMNWPEGFTATAQSGEKGDPYAPDTASMRGHDGPTQKARPHEHDMRSFAEKQFTAYVENEKRQLTEVTKTEAMREMYTWATYHHAKRAYAVIDWYEDGSNAHPEPHVILRTASDGKRRTRMIMETTAEVESVGTTSRENSAGRLIYASNRQATGVETITGCSHLEGEGGKRDWKEYLYAERNKTEIVRRTPTTMTFISIGEPWFDNPTNREMVITALKNIMCHLDNVSEGDVMTGHENLKLDGEDISAIALWDRAYGGMDLSKTLFDKLEEYAERLVRIAEDPSADHRTVPLPLNIARSLAEWARSLPQETKKKDTPIRPIETTYNGVVFRSQLEARWAAHFDSQRIPWQYERISFGNWLPDFRLRVNGEEIYAEVKPVEEFPVNVAQKIDASAWQGQAMILGKHPSFKWARISGKWETANGF